MSKELKPCPFCGGEAEVLHLPAVEPSAQWHIHCSNPDCEVDPFLWRGSKRKAIESWNTRAERTCHIVKASRKYVLSDGTELFEDGCSECNGYLGDGDNYCPNCGARVLEPNSNLLGREEER